MVTGTLHKARWTYCGSLDSNWAKSTQALQPFILFICPEPSRTWRWSRIVSTNARVDSGKLLQKVGEELEVSGNPEWGVERASSEQYSERNGKAIETGRMKYLDIQSGSEAHEILLSELHGGDFGAFTEIHLHRPTQASAIREAVEQCLSEWPNLASRVSRNGSEFRIVDDSDLSVARFEDPESLSSRTLRASQGDDLFRFHLLQSGRAVEFLFHHLLIDADSLLAFVQDFDEALSDGTPLGSGWHWDGYRPSDSARAWPAADSRTRGGASLGLKRLPSAGEHAEFRVESELGERIHDAGRRYGITPFAFFWAAAIACIPSASAAATVVSRRLEHDNQGFRGGSFSDVIRIELPDNHRAATGIEFVRTSYARMLHAWAEPNNARAPTSEAPLILSLSSVPEASKMKSVSEVILGPYVAKYRNHIQVHNYKDNFTFEAYSETGGGYLLSRYLDALRTILSDCGLEDFGDTALTVSVGPGDVPLSSKPLSSAADTLKSLLQAPDTSSIAGFAIDSIEAMYLCSMIESTLGLPTTIEDFYSWAQVSDLRRHLSVNQNCTQPRAAPLLLPGEVRAETHPHLNAVFIDSFLAAEPETYEVEYAYEINIADSAEHLKSAVDDVLRQNHIFGQLLGFEDGEVVARPSGSVPQCEIVPVDDVDQIRDRTALSLRQPQRLLSARVSDWGHGHLLYFKSHHLLMDNVSVHRFVDQVAQRVRGESLHTIQYADIAAESRRAQESAVRLWKETPLGDRHPAIGNPGATSGEFHELSYACSATTEVSQHEVLRKVCAVLGTFFGVSAGAFGGVYHGRVVSRSHFVIGSFARVLPMFFDLEDDATLNRSLYRARAGQAATARDLGFLGVAALPVVFQMVRETDFSVHRYEFPGRTKFGMVIQLVIGAGESRSRLQVAIASDVYSDEESKDLFDQFSMAFSLLCEQRG